MFMGNARHPLQEDELLLRSTPKAAAWPCLALPATASARGPMRRMLRVERTLAGQPLPATLAPDGRGRVDGRAGGGRAQAAHLRDQRHRAPFDPLDRLQDGLFLRSAEAPSRAFSGCPARA